MKPFIDIPISKAIRTFYLKYNSKFLDPAGYFEFKSLLYKTYNIQLSESIFLSIDEYIFFRKNLLSRYHQFRKEIDSYIHYKELEHFIQRYKQGQLNENIINNFMRNKFAPSKINTVFVKMAEDITLLHCRKCNKMFYPREVKLDGRYIIARCPFDNTILSNIPVAIRSKDNKKKILISIVYLKGSKGGKFPSCKKCKQGRLRILKYTDPARILKGIVFKCDTCGYETKFFHSNYVLSRPTQHLTKPLIGYTYNRTIIKIDSINILQKIEKFKPPVMRTEFIDEFLFTNYAQVKEINIGFVEGFKENAKRIHKGIPLGRTLETDGIYITIKEKYYAGLRKYMKEIYTLDHPKFIQIERLSDNELKKTVLHSLGHALWSQLPIITGVSVDNFNIIFDTKDNSLLLYELGEGGVGALELLIEKDERDNEEIIIKLLQNVRERIRDCICDDRCKYCLALKGCDIHNKYLNRFSLAPLFNIEKEELSWGL